jgi:tyrosyl-tRNA synthetase
VMMNNAEWLDGLQYVSFLREVGRHFTINRMLTFDSVKLRLDREQPMTFLEFNYMILQAYDFLELSRRVDCRLQMGGSDQWGNIVNGIELGRRIDGAGLYGVTTPLITTADGAKMGKTAQGAVWLDEQFLSTYDYWQFWRNTQDADVGRFLRLFTDVPLDEIARLEMLPGAEINQAKTELATEATAMLHGRAAAEASAIGAKSMIAAARGQASAVGTADAAGVPILVVDADHVTVLDALDRLKFATSRAEAKRKVAEGAVKVNNEIVSDPMMIVQLTGEIPISLGKKKHGLLKSARSN